MRTGTLSNGADELYSIIHDELVAHAAWEHVKDVLISTTDYRVYRCLGTVNSFGSDFYLIMHREAADELWFQVAELFNSTTDEVDNFPCNNGSYSKTPLVDGTQGWANAQGPRALDYFYVGSKRMDVPLSMRYTLSISDDRMIIGLDTFGAFSLIYAGLYDSYVSSSLSGMVFPLVLSGMAGSGYNNGAILSRHPSLRAYQESYANRDLFIADEVGFSQGPVLYYTMEQEFGTFLDASYDDFRQGEAILSRASLFVDTSSKYYGGFFGLYKDVVVVKAVTQAMRLWDYFTIGGDTYTMAGRQSSSDSLVVFVKD